jgi:hypothetical protein
MRKPVSFVVSFFVLALSISFAQPVKSADRLKERQEAIDVAIKSAQKIAEKSTDDNLNIIVNFLKKYGLPVVPVASEKGLAFKIVGNGENKKFAIAALLPGDEKLSPQWAKEIKKDQAAFYIASDHRVLVLKNGIRMSELWRGLILIHEGTHVLAHVGNAFTSLPLGLKRRSADEVIAYTYEKIAIMGMFGVKYDRLVKEEAKKIEVTFRKDRSAALPDYSEAGKLDAVFGKPLSEMERGIRYSTFWIHSVFQAIENIYGTGKEGFEEKVGFLYSAYEKNYMN